jgi:hypothetical protein
LLLKKKKKKRINSSSLQDSSLFFFLISNTSYWNWTPAKSLLLLMPLQLINGRGKTLDVILFLDNYEYVFGVELWKRKGLKPVLGVEPIAYIDRSPLRFG